MVSVTARVAVGAPERLVQGSAAAVSGSFVDPLVDRLHAEYGGDRQTLRELAQEALAGFAGARVQAFVPILVEKRLRRACRTLG